MFFLCLENPDTFFLFSRLNYLTTEYSLFELIFNFGQTPTIQNLLSSQSYVIQVLKFSRHFKISIKRPTFTMYMYL